MPSTSHRARTRTPIAPSPREAHLPDRRVAHSAESDRILDRLLRLHPKVIDLSLGRVERLLERLGRPQDSLPPVVHVAGTNGKGSVVAFLRAGLEASGLRVHTYTSPHLVRFRERIRLAGRLIEEDALSAVLAECERHNDGEPITYFEITTAAALLAFARTPADLVLLETGLGGRLDATNVVAAPVLTVITPVSLDHQQFLGHSLAEIAGEKAAIQKPGVASVVGAQHPVARRVIEATANAQGARPFRQGEHWTVAAGRAGGLRWHGPGGAIDLPAPALAGRHQRTNAGIAIAGLVKLREAGFAIPDGALAAALTRVEWPARLQRLDAGALVDRLPPGAALWLDGGHNPAAGRALAGWARAGANGQRPHLVVGMLRSKDAAAFLAPLADCTASLTALSIPGEANSLSAADTADAARRAGHAWVREAETLGGALSAIADLAPGRVLVCGSLYLAGRALAENAAWV